MSTKLCARWYKHIHTEDRNILKLVCIKGSESNENMVITPNAISVGKYIQVATPKYPKIPPKYPQKPKYSEKNPVQNLHTQLTKPLNPKISNPHKKGGTTPLLRKGSPFPQLDIFSQHSQP